MYSAVTNDIRVTVQPEYSAERSEPNLSRYFWTYTVEIANFGLAAVQLTHRHWRITDGRGRREDVDGPGVIGEQPVIQPGHTYSYTSGCPLTTPSGIMAGTYRMLDEHGLGFDVEIPAFSLDSPFAARTLN